VDRDPLESGLRLVVEDPVLADLERATEGWTLRYAVRVRDRRGRPSSLVAAEDLTTVRPPPPPEGVAAEAIADGVHLSWASGGEGVKYNVYRGRDGEAVDEAPLNAQPLSSEGYLDATAEIGVRYRYVVRALGAEAMPRRESASSSEEIVLAEDRFAPATPSGLVAVQEGSAIRLFWTPSGERDLAGYRVYRRVGDDPWSRIGPDPVVEPFFLDAEPAAGTRVSYRLTAIDRAPVVNESPPSDPIDVDVVADPLRQPGTGR
jgi:hypothetical protein